MSRIKVVKILAYCMFLVLALGVLNLEVIHSGLYRRLSEKNSLKLLSQKGARGRILDRYGNVIVDNKLSYDVMMLPQDSGQPNEVLRKVSKILSLDLSTLKEGLRNDYVAPSLPIVIARNIDIKKAIALEAAKLDLPGVLVRSQPVRNYPYGKLASQVVGYVGEIDLWRLTKLENYGYKTKDTVGFGGVEEKYDYYLRQEEGGLSFEVDSKGRFTRLLGFKQPRNGKDIKLTIDLRIQKIAEEFLGERAGCVIVMEPYAGEIIALASYPNFSPSVFIDKSAGAINKILNDPDAPLVNRAISGLYPPGSLFKLILAVASLETKKINLNTTFICKGRIKIGNKEFACWNTHDKQNIVSAIANSCNVFFYKTGLLLGAQLIHDYAVKFGFAKNTLFDLPYEAAGFVPSPLWRKIHKFRSWFDGDTANLSIGQGDLLVTPLQMTRMMAVFVNGGYLVTPYIVKTIDDKDISGHKRKNVYLGLKKSTLDYIRQGLKDVVSLPTGTGNVLFNLPISVAGKTGTAQAPPGRSHAWFSGFFPFKKPKYVICVFLERGGPGYISCVITKRIIEEMLKQGII